MTTPQVTVTVTDQDIARTRDFTGGATEYTDLELTDILALTHCPARDDGTADADPHAAAAEIWDRRAYKLQADAAAETAPTVTSRKVGDTSESYSEGGKSDQATICFRNAARHRRLACGQRGSSRLALDGDPLLISRAGVLIDARINAPEPSL